MPAPAILFHLYGDARDFPSIFDARRRYSMSRRSGPGSPIKDMRDKGIYSASRVEAPQQVVHYDREARAGMTDAPGLICAVPSVAGLRRRFFGPLP